MEYVPSRHRHRLGTHLKADGAACEPRRPRTRPAFLGFAIIDLGVLPGGSKSMANGLNNLGQVTGVAVTADGSQQAFLTGPDGAPLTVASNLGMLPGLTFSEGMGVNDAGRVAGWAENLGTHAAVSAFLTRPGGAPLTPADDLGAIPGWDIFVANGVNQHGQVVGTATRRKNIDQAFLSGPDGAPLSTANLLGTLPGHEGSVGTAVNASGEVTGWAETPGAGSPHAFLSGPDGATLTAANDLGIPPGGATALGLAVSTSGRVAGRLVNSNPGSIDPFLSGPNGAPLTAANDLGTLPEAFFAQALGVNDAGQVVGIADVVGVPHALLYADGTLWDLHQLIIGPSNFSNDPT
jgi:probable HAF family extracellular repeat protein